MINSAMCNQSGQVLSFVEELELVKEQVELEECIDIRTGEIPEEYIEMCLIITEVLRSKVPGLKIEGVIVPIQDVKSVFKMLRYKHLLYVFGKFKATMYPIKFKKAYLRTALYNSVFELESGMLNDLVSSGAITP